MVMVESVVVAMEQDILVIIMSVVHMQLLELQTLAAAVVVVHTLVMMAISVVQQVEAE